MIHHNSYDIFVGPIGIRLIGEIEGFQRNIGLFSREPKYKQLFKTTIKARYFPSTLHFDSFSMDGVFGKGVWKIDALGLFTAEGKGLESIDLYYSCPQGLLSFLKTLCTESLIRLGGIALHGAAISRNDGAYVFVADSFGGKTTLVQRWGEDGILSDDCCLIMKENDDFYVIASPFTGREGICPNGKDSKLVCISELLKGVNVGFSPLTKDKAISTILHHTMMVTNDLDARDRLLDTVIQLVQTKRVGRLSLDLQHSPWEVL